MARTIGVVGKQTGARFHADMWARLERVAAAQTAATGAAATVGTAERWVVELGLPVAEARLGLAAGRALAVVDGPKGGSGSKARPGANAGRGTGMTLVGPDGKCLACQVEASGRVAKRRHARVAGCRMGVGEDGHAVVTEGTTTLAVVPGVLGDAGE